MINNNWQVLGIGLMDTQEKSRKSSPAIPRESICPCGYDRSPKTELLCFNLIKNFKKFLLLHNELSSTLR